MKVIVMIERGNDGTYSAYIPNNKLSFGLIGDGKSVEETIKDFENSYDEMKEYYEEIKKEMPHVEFEYKYDVASFLDQYSKVLSLAGLQRLTGVNQGQLSHYITGRRRPNVKTVEKIEKSLHDFAKDLSKISFM